MLRFAISTQNVAMLRHSNIRQNCFAYEDPRYVKTSIINTIRSDYIDVPKPQNKCHGFCYTMNTRQAFL